MKREKTVGAQIEQLLSWLFRTRPAHDSANQMLDPCGFRLFLSHRWSPKSLSLKTAPRVALALGRLLPDESQDRVDRHRLLVLVRHLDVPVYDALGDLAIPIFLVR